MINKIIHFSDVHLGHKHSVQEGVDYLIQQIILESDVHTLVCMTGDLLHQRVSLDSEASGQVFKLFNTLNNLNISTVVIKGTRSHDYDYLETIDPSIFNNITFVTTLSELLIDNLTILAIPEEYMEDQIEYYKDTLYSGKRYDVLLFHGTISDVASYNEHIEAIPFKKAPQFKKSEFFKVSDICLCGHIHKHQIYKNEDDAYLSYAGSWFRATHGEEETKSMQVLEIKNNKVTDIKYINNIFATKLVTLIVVKDKDKFYTMLSDENNSSTFKEVFSKKLSDDFKELTEISDYCTNNNVYVRFIMNDHQENPLLSKLLKSLEVSNKFITILLKGKNDINEFVVDTEERAKQDTLISEIESCPSLEEEINLFIYNKYGIKLDNINIIEALRES